MTHPVLARYLDVLHRYCGRSRHLTSLALKVRNQANAVIRAHMADGTFASQNGEQLLIDVVAPHANHFVDVGANVGAWTLAFAAKCMKPARGYLYEPSPVAYEILRNALKQIQHDGTVSLEITCQALADIGGELAFYVEPRAGETSSFVAAHSAEGATPTKVRVGTLDDEMTRLGIEQVDMVKIDAEGFDCKVMRGATKAINRQAFGVIQFEYNGPWAKAGDTLYTAIGLLEGSSYQVYLLKREGLYRLDYDRYGEFFGYSNFVAVSSRYAATLRPIIVGEI